MGSGEGGSCSVPGSISDEESRVSVSEVLVGVSASCWSGFGSLQGGRVEEEVEAALSWAPPSPALSSSPLTLRRFTGVAPSSSADNKQTVTERSHYSTSFTALTLNFSQSLLC